MHHDESPKSGHSSWIADIVADWSDLPPSFRDRRQEPTDRVIERLIVANPGLERPILVLGLDGLDETTAMAAHHDAIRSVLDWFRREDRVAREQERRPIASLIVTARQLADIEDASSRAFPQASRPHGNPRPYASTTSRTRT